MFMLLLIGSAGHISVNEPQCRTFENPGVNGAELGPSLLRMDNTDHKNSVKC